MKNLPIKEEIVRRLKQSDGFSGVWKLENKSKGVENKNFYVKLTSKLRTPIVCINPSDYNNHDEAANFKEALRDTLACARLYKRLIKEGLYHPETQIVIWEDDKKNLTLMVTMPELGTDKMVKNLKTKLKDIVRRAGLDVWKYRFGDLKYDFNWGYDQKTKEFYAHDLHINFYDEHILNMAKDLGYK